MAQSVMPDYIPGTGNIFFLPMQLIVWQSPSSENISCSAICEIPTILLYLKVHYRIHKIPPTFFSILFDDTVSVE
jgi:hypothetical protein